MPSERIQRQIDRLLDEADEAARQLDWTVVRARATAALGFDPESEDARAYLTAAVRALDGTGANTEPSSTALPPGAAAARPVPDPSEPATPPIPPDPGALYRRTFVGRDAELRQLHAAFAGAAAGRGGLVMVVGEPGIGKTSLTEQLAAHVAAQGGLALVGHCYEEGSLSVPYLPFAEAMRSYVLARPAETLRAQLGPGAADVARLVPEVRDTLGALAEPPQDAPEDARWRLYQAITGFLKQAAAAQPLYIVLEDLHWADRGSLDLLVHLARQLEGARLLVCGTYRDVEVDRQHPLSGTLGELRRGSSFLRVPLRGLTVDEVHRLATAILGSGAGWAQTEAVHRQTEGNPLFIQEVLRYLAETAAERRPGEPEGAGAAVIPEGLRDVIGRRLNRLSDKANQVLAVAAVIGRDFPLEVLQKVVTVSEEELTAALEEASATAIIEGHTVPGRGIGFRFTHALFRQTLYEELFSLRRIRLHQQVARALEARYGRRVDDHAGELAEHFAQSTEVEDMRKALEYSELAARRSAAVYAYTEAISHLEQALKVLEVLDPDDCAKRCDLLLALGEVLMPARQAQRVVESVAEAAFALAEGNGDSRRAARAARLALTALHRLGTGTGSDAETFGRWFERTDRHAAPGSVERVYAETARFYLMDYSGRWAQAQETMALARATDDLQTRFFAARTAVAAEVAPKNSRAQHVIVQEVAGWPVEGVDARLLATVLGRVGYEFVFAGRRDAAEEMWKRVAEHSARSGDPVAHLYVLLHEASLLWLDGRLDEAAAVVARLADHAETAGSPFLGWQHATAAALYAVIHLGRPGDLPVPATANDGKDPTKRALWLWHSGDRVGAREVMWSGWRALTSTDAPDDLIGGLLLCALDFATSDGDRALAAALVPPLTEIAHLAGQGRYLTPVARHLGAAAALLGDIPQAEAYYRQALEVCEKIRFRPEIALTRLGLAELLLDHHPDRRAEAVEHLDFAIGEFRAMKMAPSLERVLARRGMLGGSISHESG